jgi:hypothetical protein
VRYAPDSRDEAASRQARPMVTANRPSAQGKRP